MKKSRGVLVLVLTVIVTALLIFTTAVGFGPTGTGAAKNIKTGLDLSRSVWSSTVQRRRFTKKGITALSWKFPV